MKTGEPKTATIAQRAKGNQPFFSKKGESSFFGNSQPVPHFFFSSSSHNSVHKKSILQRRALPANSLTIGQPDDKYEKEADGMADRVVQRLLSPEERSITETAVQTKPLVNRITPLIQAKCNGCAAEEKRQENEPEALVRQSRQAAGGRSKIQRQEEPNREEESPLPYLPSMDFSLPPLNHFSGSAPIDYLGMNQAILNRGLNPSLYGRSTGELWKHQYLFYKNLQLGSIFKNTIAGSLLHTLGVSPPEDDWNAWLANTTTPLAIDAALVRDFPTLNEQMERQYGMPAGTFINLPGIHFKLEINAPGDKYEREADQVADKVVRRLATPSIQRKCTHCEEEEKKQNRIQRKCAACEKEEKQKLQARSESPTLARMPLQIEDHLNASKGKGSPLPATTREQMEHSFGTDFSNVRLHTDSTAVEMNKALHAQAFTHGNDIYFNAGKFDTSSTTGKHLLAHELTHTVQQAGPNNRIHSYTNKVSNKGEPVIQGFSIPGTDYETDFSISGVKNAAGLAFDAVTWPAREIYEVGSEALRLARKLATALGGIIRISPAGIEVTLPRVCPIPARLFSPDLGSIKKEFLVPVLRFPIAPDVFISGDVGVAGTLVPELQLQIGPFCLENGHIQIPFNPLIGDIDVSGSVSASAAALLGAELRGGIKANLGLMTVIPVGPILVPISIPVIGGEGGLAGKVLGAGVGKLTLGGGLAYSGGAITFTGAAQLELNLGAALFAGAYAQLNIKDKNICRIYWEPYHWFGSIAAAVGVSGNLTINPGNMPSFNFTMNHPSLDNLPIDQIPGIIDPGGFSDDCPIIKKICSLLDLMGWLPSQNGGTWDWSGTGHGGLYGPGPLLPGPMTVYKRDPAIASSAVCRGACGPDCATCEHHAIYIYTDPITGETWQYTNLEDCNSNTGCREHDAAYDWAADAKGETGRWALLMPWHMAANIECACNNLAGNCIAWIAGLPPYDMKMYFADNAEQISSGTAQNECKEQHPGFIDCTDEGADRDEVLALWGLENGYKNFRNCKPHQDFPAGKISACDLGPGRTWHCTATDEDTREDVTISIFECYCCNEFGYSSSDWRAPHLSIRVAGGPASREVPLISAATFRKATTLIKNKQYASALEIVMSDLIESGHVNPLLFDHRYIASMNAGVGFTRTNYRLDPATGDYLPNGPSRMEIYTPAFQSIQLLVSSIIHQYRHVLQQQQQREPEEFIPIDKGGRQEEVVEVHEVEAYLWEIEHADQTGLITRANDMEKRFQGLTNHYETLGRLNPQRQKEYSERYKKARQYVKDRQEVPPPMPSYSHIYHHGTDYDTVETLRTVDITATGRVDFGQGFYTHTKDNWRLTRDWAIRHSLGKKGWGVITFPIPDRPWNEEIAEILFFRSTKSQPQNMPVNPDTGRPFKNWKDFVAYNKKQARKGTLPHWEEFDIIRGPLWGSLSRNPRIHQVMFTGSGVEVLNRPDVKPLRFLKRWLFLRFR